MKELMKLQATIDVFAYAKIMNWVRRAKDFEVSGFGKVIRGPGRLHVTDAFLLPQKNTGGTTVLDALGVSRAMYLRRDEPGTMNFWWHSHARMNAFFSGTDYDTIKELGGNGWLLATVFNAFAQTKTAVYVTEPTQFITEDVPFSIAECALPETVLEELEADYLVNVTEVPPKTSHYEGGKWASKRWRKQQKRLMLPRKEPGIIDTDVDDEFDMEEFERLYPGYD